MNERSEAHKIYEIEVKGMLDAHWQDWFEGLSLRTTENGNTVLYGVVPDQAALHGVLKKINNLGLILVSVIQEERKIDMTEELKLELEEKDQPSSKRIGAIGSMLIYLAAIIYYIVNVWPMRAIALSGVAIPEGFTPLLLGVVVFVILAQIIFNIGLGIALKSKNKATAVEVLAALKARRNSYYVLSVGLVAIVGLLLVGFPAFCMANFAIIALLLSEFANSAFQLFYLRK